MELGFVRAVSLAAVLSVASPVLADSAWVLWTKVQPITEQGLGEPIWDIITAAPDFGGCRAALQEELKKYLEPRSLEESPRKQSGTDTILVNPSKGKGMFTKFLCLPERIDPRPRR